MLSKRSTTSSTKCNLCIVCSIRTLWNYVVVRWMAVAGSLCMNMWRTKALHKPCLVSGYTLFLVLLYWSSTFPCLLQPYGNASMWSYWRSCNPYQDQRNSKIKWFHRLRANWWNRFWTQGLYTRFRVQGMRKWSGTNVAITFPTKSQQSPLKKILLVWETNLRLGSNLESKREPHQGLFSIPSFLDPDPDVNPPVSRLHVLTNVGWVYRWTQQYQYPISIMVSRTYLTAFKFCNITWILVLGRYHKTRESLYTPSHY